MTREDYLKEILELSDNNKFLMLHLPTGFGKSRIMIEIVKRHFIDKLMGCNVLIVVPKNVLKDNWKEQLVEWDFPQHINVQMTTYVSYYKYADTYWDMICFDEAHHFTEACEEVTDNFHYDRVLAMSATITKEPRWRLKGCFPGIREYKVTAREAIDEDILPDPKVILIPMTLDNTAVTHKRIYRKSKKHITTLYYHQRGMRFRYPNDQVHILCTAQQYYNMLSEDIEWYKRDYIQTQQEFKKNRWLHESKDRLTWLAQQKEGFITALLEMLRDYRTLTFCADIEQTEKYGYHPINSKNKKESMQNLADFNDRKIKHITSCGVLNEGMNLSECQVGVYANIGSSKIVELQRLGRILRHEQPVTIIPFFVGTREEEIVTKMLENYNPALVTKLFKSQLMGNTLKDIIDG